MKTNRPPDHWLKQFGGGATRRRMQERGFGTRTDAEMAMAARDARRFGPRSLKAQGRLGAVMAECRAMHVAGDLEPRGRKPRALARALAVACSGSTSGSESGHV